jgi:transcriptional regulator with XRE-family HTH domain
MAGGSLLTHELGDFLRSRRSEAVRADFELPALSRGRVRGLRREEVAYLSGVSATWYTWLEQGRDIHPSRQVLDAVARTLRLSIAEHNYVMSLAGHQVPQPVAAPLPEAVPAHIKRLMDVLESYPAYAIAPDWGIAGWNAAYEALYPNVAAVPANDRNLLWLVFTDPYVRHLLPDWDVTSRRFLAEFRAEAGPRLGDPAYSVLVERLLDASETFRAGWKSHDIEGFASRERLFCHPTVGDLHLEHHRLAPSDDPDLHLVIYTPVLDTDTPARLRRMVGIE